MSLPILISKFLLKLQKLSKMMKESKLISIFEFFEILFKKLKKNNFRMN